MRRGKVFAPPGREVIDHRDVGPMSKTLFGEV
jgi:hypothetical protein